MRNKSLKYFFRWKEHGAWQYNFCFCSSIGLGLWGKELRFRMGLRGVFSNRGLECVLFSYCNLVVVRAAGTVR